MRSPGPAAGSRSPTSGGDLVLIEGSGHGPHVRDPVKVNLLLRDFAARPPARAGCAAGPAPSARCTSPRRSAWAMLGATSRSPTSCASCIRTWRSTGWPSIPVTTVLEARGERIHPASAYLASESGHIESESAEHDLHCFQAMRRMDEILLANFMVFHDLVRERGLRPVDRRRGLGARLLPAREPGAEVGRLRLADRLRRLAADARRRRPRSVPDRRLQRRDDRADRPLPAGPRPRRSSSATPTTSSRTPSAPGCRAIRDWTEQHYDFAGYITGFDPRQLGDRASARLPRRRAGLHRHRRRLGRRRPPAAAGDRRLPRGEGPRA